jgi:phenylpropionate dioxygenase-like ring-hydroxylating dioxygenase large terminal subunit
MERAADLLSWPAEGVSRVPYAVFSDPALYRLEQERIFRGPTWHLLALECELPEPGSFKTTQIGDTPVIVVRDTDGAINAMVNRCAHKGAMLCFEPCGKRDNFTCVYHSWSYDLKGGLTSVAFRRGINGKGGMPDDFDQADHGLERLRVERLCGLVFGSFSDAVPSLEAHLGPEMVANIERLFDRPIEILGYHHQTMDHNWKLYAENVRDPYHATLLHTFFGTFRLNTLTADGGIVLGDDGRHHISYSKIATDRQNGEYDGLRSVVSGFGLADPSLIERRPERNDGISLAIQSIFPTAIVQQIHNSLAVRWLVPLGIDRCELHWTLFGYRDDDAAMRSMRRKQSNLVGPAGLVSMEDGLVGELVMRGVAGDGTAASVIEMGGRDIQSTQNSRATETSVRGFWHAYRALMDL